MRAAAVALLGAALFFAGVLVGGVGEGTTAVEPPGPVELTGATIGEEPIVIRPTPTPGGVEEIDHEVEEEDLREDSSGPSLVVDDDDTDRDDDNSGPGGGDDDGDGDNSGPGDRDDDNSGPGGGDDDGDDDDSGPGGGDDDSSGSDSLDVED